MKQHCWLLLLVLLLPWTAQAELNVYLSGNVNTQLRYTPERKLEALKQLSTDLGMQGESGGLKLAVRFAPFGDSMTWSPLAGSFPNVSLQLKRVTLSTVAPLYFGGAQATVSMGDIAVNYSPYIAQMDDTIQVAGVLYNPMPRGVSLSVPLPGRQVLVDAFALWDKNTQTDRMSKAQGLGAKISGQLAGTDLCWIQTWRGDEEEAGKSLSVTDGASLFEAKRELEKTRLWLQYGSSSERTVVSGAEAAQTGGTLRRVQLEREITEGITYGLEYVEIAAGFDPLYRDRSPRFNEEGKALKWNPIDAMRYVAGLDNWDLYGQKQYLGRINVRGGNASVNLQAERRVLSGQQLPEAKVRSLSGSYRTSLGDVAFAATGKLQELSRRGNNNVFAADWGQRFGFELSRPLGDWVAKYAWRREGMVPGYLGSWQQLILEKPVSDSLKLSAGMRWDELIADGRPGWLLGLDYSNSQGFQFEYRWSSHNIAEDASRLYGPEGLAYVGYDNVIRMGLETTF